MQFRQRLALARAVYSRKEICILDEPLSAVDAHVAKWLFDNVLGPKGVLRKTTRIIVTHRVQFAAQADLVVVMDSGQIKHVGTMDELQKKGVQISKLVHPPAGR